MTNSKMTERDIYNAMIDGTIERDVMVEFAEKKIAQLDKRNASAKARAEKKRAESDELMGVVASFVGDEPQTRAQITAAMIAEGHDVTEGKVGARLNKLVANGEIAKAKARIVGEDGKSKVATLYALSFEDVE